MLETAFTLFAAPVTWLEIAAFILSLICVALNIKEVHWAWPFTIAASALYAWLFYVSKLYGEAALQIVFIVVAFYGWWQWVFAREDLLGAKPLRPQYLRRSLWLWLAIAWLTAWLAIGAFLQHFTDTDVAWWDAFPTAGSLIATTLLARKTIENWPLWVIVNAVSIPLYLYKSLTLTAILYVVFLILAVVGWKVWHATHLAHTAQKEK
jgi:nicotinamide mononucleotide transporter